MKFVEQSQTSPKSNKRSAYMIGARVCFVRSYFLYAPLDATILEFLPKDHVNLFVFEILLSYTYPEREIIENSLVWLP